MKRGFLCLSVLMLVCLAFAQDGQPRQGEATFTYLGQLQEDGTPYNGPADIQFSLWDHQTGGARVAPVITRTGVEVRDGAFRTPVSFPDSAFNGESRWLEVSVRAPAGRGAWTQLQPRRSVTPGGMYDGGGYIGGGYSEIYAAGDRIINATDHILLNIDSNNNQTDRTLIIAKDRNGDSGGTELMRVQENGRVGIGDASPANTFVVGNGDKFQVSGSQGDVIFTDDLGGITFPATAGANEPMINMFAAGIDNDPRMVIAHSPGFPTWGLEYVDTADRFDFRSGAGAKFSIALSSGDVVFSDDQASITFPAADSSNDAMIHMFASGTANGDRMALSHSPAFPTWGLQYQDNGDQFNFLGGGISAMTVQLGSRRVGINTAAPAATLDVNGTARVNVLEIDGADLAEAFPFSETAEPGMVVSIDPQNAGQLCLSRSAYNRCVAGVIAGANDFHTGVVLGAKRNDPTLKHPVALSGRVYVWCDADANGAIQPGDLLTSSDRPGHAMKVTDHVAAQGAVIGKAMESLESGQGLVLVLVTLQ